MISKIALTASAIFLFGAGLALNFFPQETAAPLGLGYALGGVLLLQVLSAALLGMGFLNWLSKGNPMGGIYSRPLALQNFLFFGVSAVALDRAALHGTPLPAIQLTACVFTLFAVAFGWLMFFHDPISKEQKKEPNP
jgi:hypothetical protein